MKRQVQRISAGLAALAALGLGAMSLAPAPNAPLPASGGYLGELLESLVLLRDGHGARLPAEHESFRRTP